MHEGEKQEADEGDGFSVEIEKSRREIPANYTLNDPFETFADRLFPRLGILFGFGAGLLFCTLLILILLPSRGRGEFVGLIFVLAIGGGVSFIISTWLVYLLVLLGQVVFRGLEVGLKKIATGAILGGSMGLLLVVPIWPWRGRIELLGLFLLVLATVFGQLGGAVGIWKAIVDCQQQGKELTGQRKKFQFSIRQLLIVTTCCAVLLACMKFAGMFTMSFAIFLSVWFFVQGLGYLVAKSVDRKMQVKVAANHSV